MTPDWTEAYYGEMYLESVGDLLTPRLSAREAEVIAALLAAGPSDRVLDLACGHGRHARILAGDVRILAGLDRSAAHLARAGGGKVRPVRGDLRRLPFRGGAFDAAYSWYSSLFMWEDAANLEALREAARAVRPGGRLLVHHANPLRLSREPEGRAERALPGGGRVEETSHFDAGRGVDTCQRRLVRPDGSVLAATAHLRYYSPAEWVPLASSAGLRLLALTSTLQARRPMERLDDDAPDLIALAEKAA